MRFALRLIVVFTTVLGLGLANANAAVSKAAKARFTGKFRSYLGMVRS